MTRGITGRDPRAIDFDPFRPIDQHRRFGGQRQDDVTIRPALRRTVTPPILPPLPPSPSPLHHGSNSDNPGSLAPSPPLADGPSSHLRPVRSASQRPNASDKTRSSWSRSR